MTISVTLPPPVATVLEQLLAGAGVEGMHGLEVLRLVRAVDNAYDRVLNDVLREGVVTAPRWRILLRLWVEEQLGGGAVSPTHLSRTQQVAKNTISDHLRALEDAGLIVRDLNRKDRRQFQIRLTDAGRGVVQACTPGHAQQLNQLLASFSRQEIATLQDLLSRLHSALCAQRNDAPCTSSPVTVNTGANTAANTGANTAANTGANTAANTGANTAANTA